MEIPSWVGYCLQSGVSPLILPLVVVYCSHRSDATLANPSFYNDAVKGLRNMVDGRWGAAKIEQTSLDGRRLRLDC